jgi:hypothetical protein
MERPVELLLLLFAAPVELLLLVTLPAAPVELLLLLLRLRLRWCSFSSSSQ